VKALVSYAADRGVRVIPEFDLPGHAGRSLLPLASAGVDFCGGIGPHTNQVKNTESSRAVLGKLLGEMSSLFPDEVNACLPRYIGIRVRLPRYIGIRVRVRLPRYIGIRVRLPRYIGMTFAFRS